MGLICINIFDFINIKLKNLCFWFHQKIEWIIEFRDYMFKFHTAVKCNEENCDLKRFLELTNKVLHGDLSNNEKKCILPKPVSDTM